MSQIKEGEKHLDLMYLLKVRWLIILLVLRKLQIFLPNSQLTLFILFKKQWLFLGEPILIWKIWITQLRKGTNHCWDCNKWIKNFDHHWNWINKWIGSENYKWFIALLWAYLLGCIKFITISIIFLINLPSSEYHS